MQGEFTSWLWESAESTYARILAHPFLRGLTDGRLDRDAFRFYVIQDAHYLKEYARALSITAAKAPAPADTAMFAAHTANAIAVERALHGGFLDEMGGASEPPGPVTAAYTNFLLASTYGGSFAEALGAVLPCYWIYAKVGGELSAASSPDPLYQRWIDTYGGEEFKRIVDEVLSAAEGCGAALGPAERTRVRERFETAARYEWMFWDAAYRRERWPIPLAGRR
ncbi:MAG TPA: thiaminase II [Streptosporangiaceae bacterium]|nr:thiaminase II [Streptosporangiaceae bacterium]